MFCNYCLKSILTSLGEAGLYFSMFSLKNRLYSLLIVLVFEYYPITVAWSIEPEDILAPTIGPVLVLPQADFSLSYEDNVFLFRDEDKIDDIITTFSPGFGLQYGQNVLDSNYIGLDYSSEFTAYSDNSELNADSHLLNFAINYQKEGKFTFSGNNQLRIAENLLTGSERLFFSGRERELMGSGGLLLNTLSSSGRSRFEYTISPKTSVYLSTSLNILDYDEKPHYYNKDVFGSLIPYALFDISDWNNTLGFGWQISPKIKLYGSLFYGLTSVETNLKRMGLRPDSDFFGGHIAANGEFTDKLTGRIQLGYQSRNFDYLSNGLGGNNHSLPIFEADIEYKYSQKGIVSFGYIRAGNVAVQSPNSSLKSDSILLSLDQGLGTSGKLNAKFNSEYRLDSFEDRDAQEYEFITFQTGLSYSFNQWIKSDLSYSVQMFTANLEGVIDYNLNRVMLSFSVGY